MYSGQDSISTQHHAGRSRIPQATSEDILEITPDELKELQQAMLLHTQTKNKLSERKNVLHIANMDTNTMLKQIRARKAEQENHGKNNDKNEDTDSAQSLEDGQDGIIQDGDEEGKYQPDDEHVGSDEDEEMEEESSNDDNDSNRGGTSSDEDNHSLNEEYEATDHEQISQSAAIGNEPPTQMREGGRG